MDPHNSPRRWSRENTITATIQQAHAGNRTLQSPRLFLDDQNPHPQSYLVQDKKRTIGSAAPKNYEDLERAISYNIIQTHQTIQRVEMECEMKLKEEKTRYREKEQDNKHTIKSLVRQLEQEKDRRLADLTNFADLKKKVSA